MQSMVDLTTCVKCGVPIEIGYNTREQIRAYMCYRCHSAKVDICEYGANPEEIIKNIEEANECQITDYYVPRNRLRA